MNKAMVKNILKQHGYTMITKSFFSDSEEPNKALCNVYNEYGDCSQVFIDKDMEYASMQSLSPACIHTKRDITKWFF